MLQVTVEVNLDNKRAHARKTTVLYFDGMGRERMGWEGKREGIGWEGKGKE
jgi:hypothetical protein